MSSRTATCPYSNTANPVTLKTVNGADAIDDKRVKQMLTAILALALIIRLAWGLSRPADDAALTPLPDQLEYLSIARNLLAGQGLNFVDPRFGDVVHAFRTPGYPTFIAACRGSVRAVRAVQAMVDTLTCLAAYVLARRWLSPRISLFAAFFCAVNPFLVYFTGLVLTETLFTAMLAWGMVLLTRTGRLWIAGGLILALATLVRPGTLALPVVLGIVAAVANLSPPKPYHRWPLPVGATMVLLTAIVLVPWAFRNSRVVGQWIWTTTNSGFTAYDGFNPDATGASDQSFVRDLPQLRQMNEVARSQYLAERARRFVSELPARAIELAIVKVGRTWAPRPLSKEFGRPLYVAIAYLFTGPVYLLTLLGLSYRTLPRSAKLLLLVPAIYLTVSAALSVGSLRYRVPAEVPMAILAAAGAQGALARMMQRPSFKRVTNEPPLEESEQGIA
jgi:4-amino-4-deoxy-L-arabinose transferase-like glycosyltransferase